MTALLFGSISTLADTSELQREAFNQAFAEHHLDWSWSQEDYAEMLSSNGGADRISAYAEARGEEVDAAAVHATKSNLFVEKLRTQGAEPRAGVVETIEAAKQAGDKVAFVTTTSAENVAAILEVLSPAVSRESFDLVVDKTMVDTVKPDPAVYRYALEQLGEQASAAVAVEDNPGGVVSATAAGLACVAFPNTNTAGADFGDASTTLDRLDAETVRGLARG